MTREAKGVIIYYNIFIIGCQLKMKIITFDFDNTMAMSYMDTTGDKPNPVFQEYNYKIIDEIKKNIEEGNEVYLVTSRKESLEKYFPKLSIPFHLKQLGLDEYFLPDRLFYTNAGSKYPILLKLGTELHYDDDIEEHSDALDNEYQVKQPLDGFPDSDIVGKVGIFDSKGNILILQRSDEGHYWDLPGGHIKHIEVARVPNGVKDGTEREVFEETGLLLPFLKDLMVYDFNYRGKSHEINIYITQLDSEKPYVRLDIQDHIENIDYKWLSMEEIEQYLIKSTTNLRKMHSELSVMKQIFETNEPYQLKMKKKHLKGKKNMVGFGKNKNFGGGKGHSRPEMSRSKSAPPMAETIGDGAWPKKFFKERKLEENDEKSKKKVKIKVKITKKQLKAAIIKGNPEHLKKNPDISKKFYNEIAQMLKNQGFLVDFHESEAYSWPGKPKKMVYDLWIGHSLGSDRLEGAVEDGYTRKVIGFGVPDPKNQPFLAINHPNDDPKVGKVSGDEHYSLSSNMKAALKGIFDDLKGSKLDEKRKKRKKRAKKRQKSRKNKAKSVYLGGYFNLYDGDSGGGDGGGGE